MTKSLQVNDTNNIFWAKLSFVVLFLLTLAFFVNLKPRIMVIHSAQENDVRVQEINAGIQHFFAKNNQASLTYQYLDTQSNLSEIYKLKVGVLARQTVDRVNPNLIIVCDQAAQELVGRNYTNVSDKNIIFCGFNHNSQDYSYNDARNLTGVIDSYPLNALKELAALISNKTISLENPLKLIFLGDNSERSKKLKQVFMSYDWTPYRLVDLITVNTFDDWKSAITASAERADILVLADYERIFTNDNLTVLKNAHELIQWTINNTTLPIVGTSNSFYKNGGDIAITSSPFRQGEEAAKIAFQLINGQNIKDIPTSKPQDYLVYTNETPKNSRILNLPSVYKTFSHMLTSLPAK